MRLPPHPGCPDPPLPARCADTDKCIKISAQTTAALETGALPGGDECRYETRESILETPYDNPPSSANWALAAVEARCPEDQYEGEAPFPLPDQVQDWAGTLPDIYPGERRLKTAGVAPGQPAAPPPGLSPAPPLWLACTVVSACT